MLRRGYPRGDSETNDDPYEPKQWWRVLFDFQRSPVFRTLILDVLIAGAWAALVVWVETDVFKFAVLLGLAFLSILGIILGLLLVFRTNSAYDRWWEGRKIWGRWSTSRAGSRTSSTRSWSHRARAARRLRRAPRRVSWCCSRSTCESRGLRRRPRAQPLADAAPRRPTGHRGGHLDEASRVTPQPLLQAFDDVLGKCERIRKTPIPFSYSSYVKQFVVLYAIMVPFALVKDFGWGRDRVDVLVLRDDGAELLANEIEEPFGQT